MQTNLTPERNGSIIRATSKAFFCGNAVLVRLKVSHWMAVLLLPTFGLQGGAFLTNIYSFHGSADGANPYGGLIQGIDGNVYGTTSVGGPSNSGTVFQISTSGVLRNLYSFTGSNDGATPVARLLQAADGNFYGTTKYGGTANEGTVFRINTNGVLTSLHSFTSVDGVYPAAGLVQGVDGNFYGTTVNGGSNGGFGTVFQISDTGSFTSLHSFTFGSFNSNLGGSPTAGLVQGNDGSFYGTTFDGGDDFGVIFRISTNGALTNMYVFSGGNDGAHPYSALAHGSDGNFYGTTAYGGFAGGGTVFRISTNGALTNLHSFTNGNEGAYLFAGLVQGSDGYFYGTTADGGSNGGFGTVFQISTNGSASTLYSFRGGNDGQSPEAELVQDRDGNFYGTTTSGGLGGVGTVFRLTVVPEFQALVFSNDNLTLSWPTERGGRYQLQFCSDLNLSNWTNLGSNITATGATLNITESVTNSPHRFYRVVISP